jgi:hypothetical protein
LRWPWTGRLIMSITRFHVRVDGVKTLFCCWRVP